MNARDRALAELDARRLPGWRPALGRRARETSSPDDDPRDLAFAEHVTIGVIKNHALLLHLIETYSGRRRNQIDPVVQKILAIALYQLRFMDRIPTSAAVDEAVEQCRHFGRAKAAGFVNAVLRNATRRPDVPLPDPRREPERYAAVALSHPPELFRRLTRIMSGADALAFCRHDNAEPPTLLRLFRGASAGQLATEGVTIAAHEHSGIYVVTGAKRAQFESWARRGLAQVQDATSARAAEHMDLRPGQRVLDRCAGLGTKTLQVREHVGAAGAVVAIDPSPQRCAGLRAMLEARGIENVIVHQAGMLRDVPSLAIDSFDRILVDVPCSNSGVLARRPEARYAQDERALRSLAQLQRDILDDTAPYLAPGGLLVYSTCSVWPEENEHQVQWFVRRRTDFELIESRATLPSFEEHAPTRYHDGGYVAVLRRADTTSRSDTATDREPPALPM